MSSFSQDVKNIRRNIKGMRSSWNSVSEVKITAGSKAWPDRLYATKERTAASTGSEKATALFADRNISNERTKLISRTN